MKRVIRLTNTCGVTGRNNHCMSIDLNNEQVRRNFLRTQMKEGKGSFAIREKVVVFKGLDGSEYVAPQDLVDELKIDVKKLPTVGAPSKPAKPTKPAKAKAEEESEEEDADESEEAPVEGAEAGEGEESEEESEEKKPTKPARGRGK
jgi:hypothetical protein